MKPLVQPVASTLLSFVQAAQQISPLCAPGTHQPASSTSHARTSPRDSRAPPAEYRIRLSLLNTTPSAHWGWPCSIIRSLPVSPSQTITSPNDGYTPPLPASLCPSGL